MCMLALTPLLLLLLLLLGVKVLGESELLELGGGALVLLIASTGSVPMSSVCVL